MEKVLECLLCFERHSVEDVAAGAYRLETFVCSACYARMQALPHARSCFGKPTEMPERKCLGYEGEAEECARLCADRAVCRLVVLG